MKALLIVLVIVFLALALLLQDVEGVGDPLRPTPNGTPAYPVYLPGVRSEYTPTPEPTVRPTPRYSPDSYMPLESSAVYLFEDGSWRVGEYPSRLGGCVFPWRDCD